MLLIFEICITIDIESPLGSLGLNRRTVRATGGKENDWYR
jgi:hypothetical protein